MKHELQLKTLSQNLTNALAVVDDTVSRSYAARLHLLPVLQPDQELLAFCDKNPMYFVKITKLVYEKNEFAVHKLATVFHTLSEDSCTLALLIQSDGKTNDFFLGVRSNDEENSTETMKERFSGSLKGIFAGSTTEDIMNDQMQERLDSIFQNSDSVTSVTCIPDLKSAEAETTNQSYIQGLEKFVQSMSGTAFTALILADNAPFSKLTERKRELERLHTQLAPFEDMQLNLTQTANSTQGDSKTVSFGTGATRTLSSSATHGEGRSAAESRSRAAGSVHTTSNSQGDTFTTSESRTLGVHAGVSIGFEGSGIHAGVSASHTSGISHGVTFTKSISDSVSETLSHGFTQTQSINDSETTGFSSAVNDSLQVGQGTSFTQTLGQTKGITLNAQNKTVADILKRIEKQISRIEECESIGMWECAAYFLGENAAATKTAANVYYALMSGSGTGVERAAVHTWFPNPAEESAVTDNQQAARDGILAFIKRMRHPIFLEETATYQDCDRRYMIVTPAALTSTNELAIMMGLPRHSVIGLPVIEHAAFAQEVVSDNHSDSFDGTIQIGKVHHLGMDTDIPLQLDINSFAMHTFITGSTGSGKSNTVYQILEELQRKGKHFLVIEPAKGEYKDIFGNLNNVKVYGTNPRKADLLQLNPFSFPDDIHVLEHIDRLVEIFSVCWPMYAAMPVVLKKAVEQSYEDCGWDLTESANPYCGSFYPCFSDVTRNVRLLIDSSEYDSENKGAYKGSLLTRLQSLTGGINGLIFTQKEHSPRELFDENVIIDLSRVGSAETKSLLMGILVLKLQEYRMCSGRRNAELHHVTILEEAHHLLKRTSTEQSMESANLLGKSVELLTNAIAEMRTYGEGFIIADQSPGMLDLAAIRNTNTKIILRLPEQSDRELVGHSAGLNEDQIAELEKLPCGVAAIFQNNWVEAVLCRVNRVRECESPYSYHPRTTKKPQLNEPRLRLAKLLSSCSYVSHAVACRELLPLMDKLCISSYSKLLVMRLLEQPPQKPSMMKLSQIFGELFPEIRMAVADVYNSHTNPLEWTRCAESMLTKMTSRSLTKQVQNDIVQAIITKVILLERNNAKDFEAWWREGRNVT